MSHVRRDHPRCRTVTWFCMGGRTRDVVIYSRFGPNPLGVSELGGGEIWRFCIIRLVASTTAGTTVQAVITFLQLVFVLVDDH